MNSALAASLAICIFGACGPGMYSPPQVPTDVFLGGNSTTAAGEVGIKGFRFAGGARERTVLPRAGTYAPRSSSAEVMDRPYNYRRRINLLVAVRKTAARRTKDTIESAREEHLETVTELVRLREREDIYFTNKARNLARRLSKRINKFEDLIKFARPRTGAEFLNALVSASRQGAITNLIVYGHSASTGLYMLEDRGFYQAVSDVAKNTPLTNGSDADKEQKLRALGARDLSDLETLVRRGKIRFTRDAVVVFAGCGVAGATDVEPLGIASRTAEITGATVIGSIGVTDESMAEAPGASRSNEYSRGTWVRFDKGIEATKMNDNVLDVLEHLNPH